MDTRKNCYQTTLTIKDILPRDSMTYYVSIENDRGKTKFGIRLLVNIKYSNQNLSLCLVLS